MAVDPCPHLGHGDCDLRYTTSRLTAANTIATNIIRSQFVQCGPGEVFDPRAATPGCSRAPVAVSTC